jgi:hypothetical protein
MGVGRDRLVRFLEAVEPDALAIEDALGRFRGMFEAESDPLRRRPAIQVFVDWHRLRGEDLPRLAAFTEQALVKIRIHERIERGRRRTRKSKEPSAEQRALGLRLARVRATLEDFVTSYPRITAWIENDLPRLLPGLDGGFGSGTMAAD